MRWLGLRAATEYGINISLLNGIFSRLFAAERFVLKGGKLPFGVSAVCIATKSTKQITKSTKQITKSTKQITKSTKQITKSAKSY
jgi:hypothetical protein